MRKIVQIEPSSVMPYLSHGRTVFKMLPEDVLLVDLTHDSIRNVLYGIQNYAHSKYVYFVVEDTDTENDELEAARKRDRERFNAMMNSMSEAEMLEPRHKFCD